MRDSNLEIKTKQIVAHMFKYFIEGFLKICHIFKAITILVCGGCN